MHWSCGTVVHVDAVANHLYIADETLNKALQSVENFSCFLQPNITFKCWYFTNSRRETYSGIATVHLRAKFKCMLLRNALKKSYCILVTSSDQKNWINW